MAHTPRMLAWHLGWRWLRRRRAAWLALASIAATVTVSIVVMGLTQGALEVTRQQVRANASDLLIDGIGQRLPFRPGSRERIEAVNGVAAAAPYVEAVTLLLPRDEHKGSATARMNGVHWGLEDRAGRISLATLHPRPVFDLNGGNLPVAQRGSGFLTPEWREHLVHLGLDVGAALGVGVLPPPPRLRPAMGIVCGRELLYTRGLDVGDQVTLATVDVEGGPPRRERAVISDTLGTGLMEVDQHLVLVPLPQAQRMMGLRMDEIEGWRAKVAAGFDPVEVKSKLRADTGLRARTWQDQRSNLLRSLEQQRRLLAVVMAMVQVIVVFIVYAIFSTLVIEKRRDLGVLRGLGARPRQLAGAFLGAALIACLIGGLIGWGLGWGILAGLNPVSEWLGVPLFPQDVFYTAQAPVSFNPWIPLTFIASQTLIGLLAVVLPAWRAARVDPIAVLRDDA